MAESQKVEVQEEELKQEEDLAVSANEANEELTDEEAEAVAGGSPYTAQKSRSGILQTIF